VLKNGCVQMTKKYPCRHPLKRRRKEVQKKTIIWNRNNKKQHFGVNTLLEIEGRGGTAKQGNQIQFMHLKSGGPVVTLAVIERRNVRKKRNEKSVYIAVSD